MADFLKWEKEDGPRVEGTRDIDQSKVQAPGIVLLPDGGYRLYYTAVGPGRPFPNCQGYILSAFSEDGVNWERPNLGLVEYQGSKDNNIALLNAAGANVFEDARETDPARRYKSLFFELHGPDGTPNMGDGVSVAFSPDGVKWTKYEQNPVITRSSDSHTLFGWDDLHGKYVSYCRPSLHEGNKIRRIGRAVSDDFVNWTVPEDVLVPDDDDPPGMEFYGMPVFKYEDLYIGQLWAYQTPPEEPQIRFAGSIHVQLAGSRDGRVWERLGGRKPFIPNGPPGSIDHWETMTAQSPVVMGDELWFYYCGTASEHGFTGRGGPICLAKLRLDGFVSLDAGDETGTVVTKPFLCEGDLLKINASARNGMVGVAVLDESGTQHQGYSRQDCALFDGDAIKHQVTWREHSSLKELAGKIEMSDHFNSNNYLKIAYCGINNDTINYYLKRIKNFRYIETPNDEDYDYIIMTNRHSGKDQTCFDSYKGKDILFVKRNGLILSRIRQNTGS